MLATNQTIKIKAIARHHGLFITLTGLIALVMAAVNNKTAEEIKAFDMDGYFAQLGLIEHLSPSRGNGLKAIIETINELIEQA